MPRNRPVNLYEFENIQKRERNSALDSVVSFDRFPSSITRALATREKKKLKGTGLETGLSHDFTSSRYFLRVNYFDSSAYDLRPFYETISKVASKRVKKKGIKKEGAIRIVDILNVTSHVSNGLHVNQNA